MKRRMFLAMLALGIPTHSSHAEIADSKVLDAAISELRDVAGAIFNRFKGRPEEKIAYETATDAQLLAEQLGLLRVSRLFIDMVFYDIDLMKRAIVEEVGGLAVEFLQTAHQDILPKLQLLSLPLPASIDFDGEIPVEVDTRQKGKPVNGLSITFYMRGQPDDNMPKVVFNAPTTPTLQRAPPGRYIAHVLHENQEPWLERDVVVNGQGELVKIVIEIP